MGQIKFGGGSLLGGISKFLAGRGDSTPIPPLRKTMNSGGRGGGWRLRLEFQRNIKEIACEISSD